MKAPLSLALGACTVIGMAFGCGSAGARSLSPTASPIDSAAPISDALDPSTVTVTTVAVPEKITIDGDLGEWGALDVLPPVSADQKAQKPGASHVGVALDARHVHLVGSITGAAKHGLSIGLRFEAPELPGIGIAQRGGGVMGLGDCAEEPPPGFGLPTDECREVTASYEAWAAAEAARFVRTFRVDATGITATSGPLVEKAKAPQPIRDARFVSKPTADGFAFEVELPLTSLPRVATAPIRDIEIAAGTGSALAPDSFVLAGVPVSVVFEPLGAIRLYAFQFGRMGFEGLAPLSYQPGDPNKIEVVSRDGSGLSLESNERALFTKLGGEGDIEFGIMNIVTPTVLVLRGGEVIESPQMNEPPKEIARVKMNDVDGWLLASPWVRFRGDSGYGYDAGFDTVFIGKNGSVGSGLWRPDQQWAVWEDVSPWMSADLETLTLSGNAYPMDGSQTKPRPTTYTWKLDHVAGYVADP